ncbi:MAG: methyltransferase, partial [Salaquimonas sp.]
MNIPEDNTARRSGGRAQRHVKRAAKPVFDPCPPGQIGGAYKPLSDSDLESIFDTALKLLSDLGMGEVPARLHRDLLKAGATANENGRILFPR